MDVENIQYEGNSKFIWDGEFYDSHKDADDKKIEYEGNEFEVRMFEQEGKHLLYTRREVKEIILDGSTPV
jgi:hypothetical protein